MSQGLNRADLIGNLGQDPELRYTNNGQACLNLRIAVNERWQDKSGEKRERTEWFTVVMWGKRAEALNKHLAKGQSVYVSGRLTTRQWEDKDGNKRSTTEIVANELLFLGGGKGGDQRAERPNRGGSGRGAPADDGFPPDDGWGGDDDQIPFREVDERLA